MLESSGQRGRLSLPRCTPAENTVKSMPLDCYEAAFARSYVDSRIGERLSALATVIGQTCNVSRREALRLAAVILASSQEGL